MLDQQKDWTFKLFLHNFFKENNLKSTLNSFESEVLQSPNFNQDLPIKSNRTFLLEMWNIFFHLYGQEMLKDFCMKNGSLFPQDLIDTISFAALFKPGFVYKQPQTHNFGMMDLNSVFSNNPLILSTLESFKNFSRSLNMNQLGALNLNNLSNMNLVFNGMNPNPLNYDLSLMAKTYSNLSGLNNLTYGNKDLPGQGNNSETSSISLGSDQINTKGDSKQPIKIFNTNNVLRRHSNYLDKDSLFKKRKRYIKNNKFVYVHPGSAAAKKMELEKNLEEKNKEEEEELKVEEEEGGLSDFNMNNINHSNNSECSNRGGKKPRGSRYRGVSRNGNQWQVLIMVNKKKRYVGSYSNEEEAARAYDKVALQNHGTKAKTNFDYLDEEVRRILLEPPLLKISY